jgi:hypothetical protein
MLDAPPIHRPTSLAESAVVRPGRGVECCLWLLLFAVLVINAPAFLRMGLDPDAMQWDLGAHTVLQGGIPYQDWIENNLPGMLWLHVLIRSVLGWRSEALRLVDLLIVLTLIWQLTRWLPASAPRNTRLGTAGVLLVFYLSTSEWCHCQRDVWMLLPALLALSLRLRQVRRLFTPETRAGWCMGAAFAEGGLWGVAFWIKPVVVVPALLCWLLSARLAWPAGGRPRKIALDAVALISGGLASGAAGVSWLVAIGAWPAFAEILFVWNREYLTTDVSGGHPWLLLAGVLIRFFPWLLIHFLAVPVAVGQVGRAVIRLRPPEESDAQTLLAGLYLGWLLQAVCLQHLYDYVQTPPVLLGLTVVACRYAISGRPIMRPLVPALFLVFVLARFPALCVNRLTVWVRCCGEESNAALRDRLTLLPKVNWSDLERVKSFLRDQGVRDGELSCTHMSSLSLYRELHVNPATRSAFLHGPLFSFRGHRDTLFAEVAASRQRFLVCDAEGFGMEKLRAALHWDDDPESSPPPSPYPWSNHLVFRSGRYLVFRLSGSETQRWFEANSQL